mgnify:FL=1
MTDRYPLPPGATSRRLIAAEQQRPGAKRALPHPSFRLAVALSAGASILLTVFAIGAVIVYDQASPRPPREFSPSPVPTTIDIAARAPNHLIAEGQAPAPVTFDASGAYAFPIAADPAQWVWTHLHWDGTNAVDIEVHPSLSYPEFVAATNSVLVAVTNGLLVNYSGSVGGRGYILHGDDGLDYYYAHMAEQWAPDGAHVTVGQPLGVVGNTGNTAQFIEPHLHFAIGPRDSLWTQQPGINAAEWIQTHFGFPWDERPEQPVAFDAPQGPPVVHPHLAIVTPFESALDRGLAEPSIELGFDAAAPSGVLDVIAPISGTINVIRWTAHYGTRIQITNDPTQTTVVISGVDDWLVRDGEAVRAGQAVGRWNPANRPRLHYMIFQNGVIIDPTPTLGLDRGP